MRQNCNEIDKKIDVYAFAITMLEMFLRGPAWGQGISTQDIIRLVSQGGRPGIPPAFEADLAHNGHTFILDLIKASWQQHPLDRPSFAEIVDAFSMRRFAPPQ